MAQVNEHIEVGNDDVINAPRRFARFRRDRPRRVKAHWGSDPWQRADARYWNGRRWTQHVVINGRQAIDQPDFGGVPGPVVTER